MGGFFRARKVAMILVLLGRDYKKKQINNEKTKRTKECVQLAEPDRQQERRIKAIKVRTTTLMAQRKGGGTWGGAPGA